MAPSEQDLDHDADPPGGHRVRTLLASVRDLASSLHRLTVQLERELEPWPEPGAEVGGTVWEPGGVRAELERLQAELEQLRAAQEARLVIEQAKGMLMAAQRCSDRQAFELLVGMSQAEQRKVREIAAELVAAAVHGAPERNTQPGQPGQLGGRPAAAHGSSCDRPGGDPARQDGPPTPATVRPGLRIDLDHAEQTVPAGRRADRR